MPTGDWTLSEDETHYTRTSVKVCDYCGYSEETEETGYSVSYDLNGGTGSGTVDYSEEIVAADAEMTVKAAPSRDSYIFTGWSDGNHTYQPGDELTVTGNIILTAQWSSNSTVVSGSNTWDDADNKYAKRPESITINLLKNGEKIDSKTMTADDGWSWTFDGLAKYENGIEITYSITEDAVEGYRAAYNGYNVTNSYTPEQPDGQFP